MNYNTMIMVIICKINDENLEFNNIEELLKYGINCLDCSNNELTGITRTSDKIEISKW
jgi:hypothetical protein